ncbi:PREDICTED: esterase OVCA2 [Eufriesea mexicana]|uniref:esterase OVCA2 n=1 Tax=Eufriesea mexicana TaxID=516756 RepID=UPI00083C733A|nr:PREDICTED: esterase OVCA2 [Eufriesea mexicana]
MNNQINKLRILAIHGYAQSDVVFKSKLGSLRKAFKKQIDFVFLRGPHKVPMKSNFNIDGPEEAYGWWFNTEDHIFKAIIPSNLAVGFEDSVAVIEKAFQEFGSFDGILGFSQGAAFATILCFMKQKNLLQIKFDFVIIISGFKSLCAPHAIYYNEMISIPSLHVYGKNDQVIPTEMAREVSEMFINKTDIIHEGGHYIPGKKEHYKEFIIEMLLNKNKMRFLNILCLELYEVWVMYKKKYKNGIERTVTQNSMRTNALAHKPDVTPVSLD